MKFCYVDESGMGAEPYLVMAGVIVDATRMHVTKVDWGDVLTTLSEVCGRRLTEFHTRDVYRGTGPWHRLDGRARGRLIGAILEWWADRKHSVTFSAVDKAVHEQRRATGQVPLGCETAWKTVALHVTLSIQKHHQRIPRKKGHTVLLFDREVTEEREVSRIIATPPEWTDGYYGRDREHVPLDQIVDVPFFGESHQVLLLQVADLVSYLLRRYAELEHGVSDESYNGERGRVRQWVGQIIERALPVASRWPRRALSEVDEFFRDLAPMALRDLGD